jgi:hypothetical protein
MWKRGNTTVMAIRKKIERSRGKGHWPELKENLLSRWGRWC